MNHNITEPMRLAAGSHREGSGVGCAMNVVSWINGDAKITDSPSCSSPTLALLVQQVNDHLAYSRGGRDEMIVTETGKYARAYRMLSPESATTALELGIATMGTASATDDQIRDWLLMLIDRYGNLPDTIARRIMFYRKPNPMWDLHVLLKPLAADLYDWLLTEYAMPDALVEVAQIIHMFRYTAGLEESTKPSATEINRALIKMGHN